MRQRKTTAASRAAESPFVTETVWNAGLAGTGVAADDRSLTVGHDGEWVPEHLLLLAAESCFMSTLLAIASADGVTVLGYVSSGHLTIPTQGGTPSVSLAPCVVVASADDERRIAQCARQAEQASVVARLLGDRLQITLDVRRLPRTAAT
jgi:organic hydroperoxide reductase OsmC/OhrA